MTVDLRSDTVTKPTPGMLDAMWSAKVGDDVFGEDETVNALEEKAAAMFGMEAAIYCPSGTMTNQIAIKCFTQPLDELIADQTAHVYRYEGGGIAFNSGVSTRLLNGYRGILTAEMIAPEINADNIHYPHTSLVVLENTVNKGGGSCYTLEQIKPIAELCKQRGLKLHLDGARIFNALAHTGDNAAGYGTCFDGISVCLSKGLGAPVGSVLLADKATIKYARRIRKVLGGGMRQAGFLAAAGIYALDHHVERLKIDHAHARILGEELARCNWVSSVLPVETNIVLFDTTEPADTVLARLQAKGIKAGSTDTHRIRFVTHLDVHAEQVEYVVNTLKGF
ncbi:aminotransferase class I/II-fold pyridoxal phosphate-dependent enzyme [Mucilaginibacter phyllosphaerae]|uniref:Aminotransferase class I/II-fold pyridoxal phosphate-dependent enzyme n=1 Tax=Mucilaginibacter phyllosphaerae TaxID=1812349 RepID=A0A4Y8A924_9SPHI|nr:GntG family PLP-dependent aldolase [Mucilaginibacter phyllosphaerae]TEW64324.1 aminotransferase class I/II-fold pyridoxal phosphate-dependent enzyme [Mucilaginibacter phyllosphaerae]